MISKKQIYLKTFMLLIVAGSFSLALNAQKAAYRLFREDGRKVKYEKMLEQASGADIVLFGEYHTNPISHWLQLELTTDLLAARGKELILGAEMFEADNQLILDEYLAGLITEEKFEEEARLWKNYQTDYKPLVLLAKGNGLTFVASNIPRRYANMVFKKGVASLDSLSEKALSYMAPLPLEYDTSLNCYRQLMGSGRSSMSQSTMPETPVPGTPVADTLSPVSDSIAPAGESTMPMAGTGPMGWHGSINLADAQAIKDATMAHFILEHWKPGKLFVHYNGAYHSDDFESMNWFLRRSRPDLKILTISTVSQEEVDILEEEAFGKADFIIAVPSNMTQTHR
ncbi:MAG: ChaN family lipoprotein [Bacteroidales bacterium]|nr:ChaN family lipoprotein [Bacteroidales bacterium]